MNDTLKPFKEKTFQGQMKLFFWLQWWLHEYMCFSQLENFMHKRVNSTKHNNSNPTLKKKVLRMNSVVVGPTMFSRLRHSVTEVLGILASVGLQLMSFVAFVEGSCLVQKSTSFPGTNPPTPPNRSMKKFSLRCLKLC